MSQININGNSYSGRSIRVENGKVFIDGKEQTTDDKIINIYVVGDVDHIDVATCENLIVDGNVRMLNSVSGDIEVTQNVTGDIKSTSGDVEVAGDCGGSINTVSGDVKARNVSGVVKTMSGDIKYSRQPH